MYIPSATVDNITGSEYMDIIGMYASGGSGGAFLRVMAGGALYVSTWDIVPDAKLFNIYGTIPTDQWFDLEIGMESRNKVGIQRSFCFLVNGAFYGWYRRSNDEVTIDRIAAGILSTNSADDLTVYVDNWDLYSNDTVPCGPDNRPTAAYFYKDYTTQSGENVEIHWYTWIYDVRLDATHGIWSHDTRLQGGINHALMPSLASDGWAEITIGWPNGTPSLPPGDSFILP